ncbi:MAG TPA: hypothetical protein VH309_10910 [Elusimicrobiota bacterium]|jgi:hypothetical protein|nr:hypothetical protein [Elusimicrobiota bacterium]
MKPRTLPLLLVAAALLRARPAAAYRWDEHYYTVRLAFGPRAGGEVASLCAQLADEAPELSAIAVYRRLMTHPLDYLQWALLGTGPDETVGRMVTIQQLQHGLTGGSPEAVREIARATATTLAAAARGEKDPLLRANARCALGFALHLYGDSFAHARIRNPARMYGTGLGHFFDATRPDQPLSSAARLALWRDYLATVPALISAGTAGAFGPVFAAAAESQPRARAANGFSREALMHAETSALEEDGIQAALIPHNVSDKPCQAIVDAAAKGLPAAPTCEGAWALYRGAVVAAFDAYDADPAHAGEPSRAVRLPFFMGSPFSKGADW